MHLSASFEYAIDENGLLFLVLESDLSGVIHSRLYSRYIENSDLVKNIIPLISLGGKLPSDVKIASGRTSFDLSINNQIFARFKYEAGEIRLVETLRKLSVFETRIIGRGSQSAAPYPVDASHYSMMLQFTPLTDLHTHLSGQVAGADLIAMGLTKEHEVLYPVAALDMLGIEYSSQNLTQIPKRVFLPLAHLQAASDVTEHAIPLSQLSSASLERLQNALNLSPETQSTFEKFENCYYLREPFTKDIRLLPQILRNVAEKYKSEGIVYAEMSSNAVLEPQWLKVIHEVMPGIERSTGVQLRFRAGLPRNLDEEALSDRIELYKQIAESPYIVGPDILGYEMNKTSQLETHLDALLGWMQVHQPDASIQIHAGENSKNPANVKEALKLALRHDIRLMIGHSLYGIDAETMELACLAARSNKLIVQFLFDSNIAGNNIDFPEDATIAQFLRAKIPCVLASDGAALYLTSARQIAMAGLFCGVSAEDFALIRETEIKYINEQQASFAAKKTKFNEKDFLKKFEKPPNTKSKRENKGAAENGVSPELKRLIESKRPLFFAGAGGSSWSTIAQADKDAFVIGLDALLGQLNPEKVYFLKGRTKASGGVNLELEKAVLRYNELHEIKFACVTLLVESEYFPDRALNHHTLKLPLPLISLPGAVTDFLKTHRGCAFYFGGRKFTRDFILESVQKNIPFGLMKNVPGASQEKAKIYCNNGYCNAEALLDWAKKSDLLHK